MATLDVIDDIALNGENCYLLLSQPQTTLSRETTLHKVTKSTGEKLFATPLSYSLILRKPLLNI